MLRRDDNSVLRVALDFQVSGERKRKRPKTRKKQMEEETEKIGLTKEDAWNRAKWKNVCEQLRKDWGESAISAKGPIPNKN